MSELKVNAISGLGNAGVKINAAVGINTAPPTATQDGLYVKGNVDVNGAIEVVTVTAENYGVRIKSPNNTSNSTLQFTDLAGVERGYIRATPSNVLGINAGGITGMTISQATIDHLINSRFSNDATFNDVTSFNSTNTFSTSSVSNFNGAVNLNNTTDVAKCYGNATLDDDIVNFRTLKKYSFSIDNVKTWQVGPGGYNNDCFNNRCCGQACGSEELGSYDQRLDGTWIVLGWRRKIIGCSCSDNETFDIFPSVSRVWRVTNNTIKNTIAATGLGVPSFGFAVKAG